MGHCLWTGIVDEEKAPFVAQHLVGDGMFSGWGIRTLSAGNAGYNPISYHCGSVWPHDNALAAAGLMRYGFADASHRVMRGMVDASRWFGDLLPELFAGMPREGLSFPVSYPTSCSPQAWAAASPLLFLRTLLAVRTRHPCQQAAPRARGAGLDRNAATRTHPDHGRSSRGRGDGRGREGARGARGADDRVGSPAPDDGQLAVRELPGERRARSRLPRRSTIRRVAARPRPVRARRAARVNLALTSVRISSPSANDTSRSSAPTRTVCARVERRRISIHSRSRSKTAT